MPDFRYERLQDPADLETASCFEKLEKLPVQDQYSPYKAKHVHAAIRLLTLEPGEVDATIETSLTQVNLKDLPRYQALSYVWGDQGRTQTIKCNGYDLRITPSLHTALRFLRSSDTARVLWVDAVCIDQDHLAEKQQQVLLMDSIYSLSQSVLVWLGMESNEDQRAVGLIQTLYPRLYEIEMQHRHGTDKYGSSTRHTEMRSAICEGSSPVDDLRHLFQLLDRPWFHRIWTVQEFAKASEPVMIYGKRTLSADELAFVLFRISWNFDSVTSLLGIDEVTRSEFALRVENFTLIHSLRFSGAGGQKEPAMRSLLAMTSRRKSADPKDRLYALLSLASQLERSLVQPDYSPTVTYLDVLKKFTISTFVELQSLKYLWPSTPTSDDTQDPQVPSWFTDPCVPSEEGILPLDDRLYKAAGDTKASLQVSDDILSVLGKRVDTVVRSSTECYYEPRGESKEIETSASLQKWLKDSHDIAFGDLNDDIDMSHMATRGASYARTLMLECQPFWSILLRPDEITALYEILQRLLIVFETKDHEETDSESPVSDSLLLDKEELEMISGLGKCFRRKFCTTTSQRFAAAPRAVKRGDIICVLHGHGIPQLLRDDGDGHYRLIGGCYVDGLMHGEAMQPRLFEDQVFKIR